MKTFLNKHQWIPSTVLAVLLAFIGLGAHSYELDEAFSLYVSVDFSTMINILWSQETNMWFYYLLLHFWQYLGTNEIVIRSLSVIFAISSIPVVFKTAESLFNKKVAKTAAMLTALSVIFIYYSQIARSYMLLLLLTSISAYSFLRFKKANKYKVIYALSSALALYTHFYAGFVLLSQLVVIMTQGKLKTYLPSLAIVCILFLPILIAPSLGSSQISWMSAPTLTNLLSTVFILSGDFLPLFAIYGLVFISFIPFLLKHCREDKYMFLVCWLLVPIISAYTFSIVVKPVYQSVYFLFSLPPFTILIAKAIEGLRGKNIKTIIFVSIIIFSIVRLLYWYASDNSIKSVINNNPEDWRALSLYITKHVMESDAVIFFGYYNRMPYELYSNKEVPKIVEIATDSYSLGAGTRLPAPNLALISQFVYPRVWLILRNVDNEYFDRKEQRHDIILALSKNYVEEDRIKFSELEVVLFEKI